MIITIIFLSLIIGGIFWFIKDYHNFKKEKERETINKIKRNGKSNTGIQS